MNNTKLNWLRAGVLGANDGIISVSVILVSVVGVLQFNKVALVGISAILAGALSMAIGEYVSVSAQRDAELSANRKELTNPWHAAISSFLAFTAGAVIPFGATLIWMNAVIIVVAVLAALVITTLISVRVGKAKWYRPLLRNLVGGGIALGLGVALNQLFGA